MKMRFKKERLKREGRRAVCCGRWRGESCQWKGLTKKVTVREDGVLKLKYFLSRRTVRKWCVDSDASSSNGPFCGLGIPSSHYFVPITARKALPMVPGRF
jgi:hypothetical protein